MTDEEKKIVGIADRENMFMSFDSPFLNSDNIVIEYNDIIKTPMFIFLDSIRDNEQLNEIFDLSEILNLSLEELGLWYFNRKNQHIMLNFKVKDEHFIEEAFENNEIAFLNWCVSLPFLAFDCNPELVYTNTELAFAPALPAIIKPDFVKRVFIYTEFPCQAIIEDYKKLYDDNKKVLFVSGPLKDVITQNKITENSTFIFSDITKIRALVDANVLKHSSILIAEPFLYNYNEDKTAKVDINWMQENVGIFKIDWFNNLNNV